VPRCHDPALLYSGLVDISPPIHYIADSFDVRPRASRCAMAWAALDVHSIVERESNMGQRAAFFPAALHESFTEYVPRGKREFPCVRRLAR